MDIFLCVPSICHRTRLTNVETKEAANTSGNVNPSGMDLDLPVDPNEPTYCFCNQVSYGEMVACDNPDVCDALEPSSLLCHLGTLLYSSDQGFTLWTVQD